VRIAYFDCFNGVAGDMLLAALHDAGCPADALRGTINSLALPGVKVHAQRAQVHGLAAMRIQVVVGSGAPQRHRHLPQIVEIIERAALSDRVKRQSVAIFRHLAEAEAAVHATGVENVHFHEVGADDAIVDIVCTCAALEHLGVEAVQCSPIPPGSGAVACEHGVMPVPAPATALLLKGAPLASTDEPGELATPTGVAIVTTLAQQFGPLPEMTVERLGVGAGSREGKTRPNILRVFIGDTGGQADMEADTVIVLETQVDDASGQVLAHTLERALGAGALDAYIVPITMKKTRPGCLLTVLTRPADMHALETLVFEETGTLGIRRHAMQRSKLRRRHVTVSTAFGDIRVKVGQRGERAVRAWPEYEDCAAAALRHDVPLRQVQDAVLEAWRRSEPRA
jgi:uncharacterized protein (TIGR00299 family) protein